MPRVIWKGAISFGLVHVPVALYPASSEVRIDFDWLDKRSMDPVGYKRINKRTGREIDKSQIVRGVKVESGEYAVIGDDQIKAAYPRSTQTIEIESFAHAEEIPFTRIDKPYYLEPLPKGGKVYALLREAMVDARVIGIARVVIHTKQYLAAVVPVGPALMLTTLRWPQEIRPWTELDLPAEGKAAHQLKKNELDMAGQLIAHMTVPWNDEHYQDTFSEAVNKLVEQRVAAGATEQVQPLEEAEKAATGNVVDLTELLARSLGRRPANAKESASASATASASASTPAARKRSPSKAKKA